MISLLIADDDINLCNVLKDFFNNTGKFKVIGITHDGKQTYQFIKKYNPEIAIIDYKMPIWDGLEVIKQMFINNINPNMIRIILTGELNYNENNLLNKYNQTIKDEIEKYNGFYVQKPFDYNVLVDRILSFYYLSIDIGQQSYDAILQKEEIKTKALKLLNQQGKKISNKGCQFILEAIIILYYNIEALDNLTKNIFDVIAKIFNTTSSNVERQMRYCINHNSNTLSKILKNFNTNIFDKKNKHVAQLSIQQFLQNIIIQLKQDI